MSVSVSVDHGGGHVTAAGTATVFDLAAPTDGASARALAACLTERARRLLDEGAPLVGSVRGWLRLLLAGVVGGGRAAARAIADAGHDVLAGPPRTTRGGLPCAAGTTLRRGT